MSETAEEWRSVVGAEGEYEVSDAGRVRSLDRRKVYLRVDQYSGRALTITRTHRGKILAPGPQVSGHLTVVLGRARGSRQVHAMVLEAFIGPCPAGMECLHEDGVPSNNRLENLRWGTRSENILDAVRHGAKKVGELHKHAKLKNKDIPFIRSLLGAVSMEKIAKQYGVSLSTIRQIKEGRCWKSVREAQAP